VQSVQPGASSAAGAASKKAPRRKASPNGSTGSATATTTGAPHPELEAYRAEFPILQRKTYLNSCSLGALSRRSMEAMTRFQELWNEHGAQAWYTLWMGELAAMREKFARLINAKPHEVALAPNVSVALGEIASALDFSTRNRVVLADMDFPTLAYQWLARQRLGVEVDFVRSPDHVIVPAEAFIERIDDRTALAATSRVSFLNGYIQDVRAIAEAAHRHGAYVLVDDYQGTGQIPLDVKALDVDFLVTGTLKWLMGGPGLALMYVREDLIPQLQPAMTGWFASRDQFAFRTTQLDYKEDARRLEAGTPSVAAIYCASAAIDIVHEIGVPRIRERTRFLGDDLARRALAKGWRLLGPDSGEQRSSIVVVGMERPEEIVQALTSRNIIVDSRPDRVRISPHFYNTVEENEAIVEAMDEILRERGH
jgi:kynureninase